MAKILWADVLAMSAAAVNLPAQFQFVQNTSLQAQATILAVVNGTGLNVCIFGGEGSPTLQMARALYAAHLATLAGRGAFGISGPITSQTEGGASQTYGWPWGQNPPLLMLTGYGQALAQLIRGTSAYAGFLANGVTGGCNGC